MDRRIFALSDALRPVPKFDVGGWACVYNTADTLHQGAKSDTDDKVVIAELLLNLTSLYKVLAVGSCSSALTQDGSSLGAKLLYLDLPYDMPRR